MEKKGSAFRQEKTRSENISLNKDTFHGTGARNVKQKDCKDF
jgi:hypothetical protein